MTLLQWLLLLFGIGYLICWIIILIKMFQNWHKGLAILSIALASLFGIGTLITFIFGWKKAREWDDMDNFASVFQWSSGGICRNVMRVWTVCIVGVIIVSIILKI